MAKRLLALLLSILILGSLAACSQPTPTEAPTNAPTVPPVTDPPTEPPTETPTDAPTEPPAEIPTDAPTEPPTEPPTETPTDAPTEPPVTEPPVTFEDVEETVYTTDALNVRSGPGTEFDKIGLLELGEAVTRTGIGSNGWSRIIYNGETAYVHGDYVSTEPPATEPPVTEPPAQGSGLLEGFWVSICREYRDDGSDLLEAREFEFYSDGTGIDGGSTYCYYPDMPEGTEGNGWSVAGMGYEVLSFTYTLEGDQLVIHYEGYTDPGGDWCDPWSETYTVVPLDGGLVEIGGRTYVRGEGLSLQEVCEALDVDCSHPAPEYLWLMQDWISVTRDAEDMLRVQRYSFTNGQGTVDGEALGCDPEGEWYLLGVDGPYGFSYELFGDMLMLSFDGYEDDFGGWHDGYERTYTIYQLDEDTLVISDDFGTYIPDTGDSLEAVCDALGVDYAVADKETPPAE